MFWALNGATEIPCRASQRHSPAAITLLPASELVPATSSAPFTRPPGCVAGGPRPAPPACGGPYPTPRGRWQAGSWPARR